MEFDFLSNSLWQRALCCGVRVSVCGTQHTALGIFSVGGGSDCSDWKELQSVRSRVRSWPVQRVNRAPPAGEIRNCMEKEHWFLLLQNCNKVLRM